MVDVVLEVRDARIPVSTAHPQVGRGGSMVGWWRVGWPVSVVKCQRSAAAGGVGEWDVGCGCGMEVGAAGGGGLPVGVSSPPEQCAAGGVGGAEGRKWR